MRQILKLLRRFRADERGAFGVIFGILAIVLIATSGAVIDFTTLEQARTRAQDALDSAALGIQPTIYDADVTEDTVRAKALLLLNERLGTDTDVTASIEDVTIDEVAGLIRLHARITVPMVFVALVGVNTITADVVSEATRGTGANIEVALVLDITGSMSGSKIETLRTGATNLINAVVKDDQSIAYSKVAIVPFSIAVDVGTYLSSQVTPVKTIADVRGTPRAATAITAANWRETPTTRTIASMTKANPTVITTTAVHGLTAGTIIYISGIAGGSSFTALNNKWYRVSSSSLTTTTFRLQDAAGNNVSLSGVSGSYTANSATITIWPSARAATTISKANPGLVTTSAAHSLVDGDAVYITDAAGGSFTGLNVNVPTQTYFIVDYVSTTTFRLHTPADANYSTSSFSGTYTGSSAIVRKCLTKECEVVVTSANHGMSNDDYVYIASVGGMTQINSTGGVPNHYVSEVQTNTFVLEDTAGLSTSAYTSGGTAQCAADGCPYNYFKTNDVNWSWNGSSWVSTPVFKYWPINTKCVTERRYNNQYTDAAPSTSWIGPLYTSNASTCSVNNSITPLSASKSDLTTKIAALSDGGATAGHIGIAWGWYMLAPNFASLWPAASAPGAYDDDEVVKVVVFMTDGVFNTAYCKGVVSNDFPGTAGDDNRAQCNATNGTPNDQTAALCAAMKGAPYNIEVFTILFQVTDPTIELMLETCATDSDHYYDASNNQDLLDAFEEIGGFLSELRLAE